MSRTDKIISRFPDFYQSEDSANLFYAFISVFAKMLDEAEEDLLGIMRTHWANTADNAGSKGFDAAQKGDLDKIFALYLESLGGTSLIKQGNRHADTEGGRGDDALYRKRILSVINVLKNGAATKQGIIDIIAANLGIADDLPFAEEAKKDITIEEFLPEIIGNTSKRDMKLFETFDLNNESLVPAVPEFRITAITLPALFNPRFVNLTTGESVAFRVEEGEKSNVKTGVVNQGDELFFLSNGQVLRNGEAFKTTGIMTLPPGISKIRFEAEVGLPVGFFDFTNFDIALFDVPKARPIGRFDDTTTRFDDSVFNYEDPIAKLVAQYKRLYPGTFKALVSWDIAGFTVTIKITKRTLERLSIFGVSDEQIAVIGALKDKEFETIDAFYDELHEAFYQKMPISLLDIEELPETEEAIKTVQEHNAKVQAFKAFIVQEAASTGNATAVKITDKTLQQLKKSGLPQDRIKVIGLLKNKGFETTDTFFAALHAVFYKEIPRALSEIEELPETTDIKFGQLHNQKVRAFKKRIIQESELKDKYARLDISPRAQIATIVNRVKAAGVYAVVSFEKRFFEHQQLGENLAMVWHRKPEEHGMSEGSFMKESIQKSAVEHEMSDTLTLTGMFDYTAFDSLNVFA